MLAEYKGPSFAKHLLKDNRVWRGMVEKLLAQAGRQELASKGWPIVWFVAKQPLARFLRRAFDKKYPDILVV